MFALAAVALAAALGAATNDPFYQPPDPLPAGMHGDLIRQQPLTDAAVLPSAARNVLVLYHTQTEAGADVAVSGTVAIPKGTPPAGGWPIVTWAHGTTGDAPACTPSRDSKTGRVHDDLQISDEALNDLVAHGYAVVQSDYEGQGTPGVHPYMVGGALGHDVLDIVRAARQVDGSLGTRYAIAGHSEGGFVALFAASLSDWMPELKSLGAAVFAPASHLDLFVQSMRDSDRASSAYEFGSLIIAGYAQAYADVRPQDFLTPNAFAMLGLTQTRCGSDPDAYWSLTPPPQMFRHGADIGPLIAEIKKNDPAALHIGVPILILQGDADRTVPPALTNDLQIKLCANGTTVDYRTYAGKSHGGIIVPGMDYARTWFDDRFANKRAPLTCLRT